MKLSILIPAYNEQDNLGVLYQRLNSFLSSSNKWDYEILFIDDNSSDNTPDILRELNKKDKRVKMVRFTRNCGSHAALSCGLNLCQGDIAVTLAADLQDPPEIIKDLIKEWEGGKKIVWGARKKRKGESAGTKLFSRLYYKLVNWLTDVNMPPLGADVFLIDKAAINAFREFKEKHTSIFMAIAWLGFKQSTVFYEKEVRHSGKSKWNLAKKIKLALDSLLSFSDIPIRYMSVIGVLFSSLGFIYAVYVLWTYLNGSPVEGWSSLMVVILVMGGVQMITLGILGEYLWRTFDESRRRPRYVIEYRVE